MRHLGFPPPLVLRCLLLFTACSGGGEGNRLLVGDEPGSSDGGPSGGGGPSGPPGAVDDSTRQGLEVHVEDAEALRVEIVTVSCAGDCVDITAVASGGYPPYAFEWEDGSTTPERTVCPDVSGTLRVETSDSGLHTSEFRVDAMKASADVRAEVLDCAEGGGDLCIENGSFEGTPGLNETSGFDAAPWEVCKATPDIVDGAGVIGDLPLEPADGLTYLRTGSAERAGERLCAPIEAGATAYLRIDLAAGANQVGSLGGVVPFEEASVQLWGGTGPCDAAELLYESELLEPGSGWTTHCVSLSPSKRTTYLTIAAGSGVLLYVDNIVPVAACPP